MRKFIIASIALGILGAASAFAQMTDDQIISYIKSGVASGKGEKQIGTELLSKGVTMDQLQRLQAKYEQSQGQGQETISAGTEISSEAIRSKAQSVTRRTAEVEEVASANDPTQQVKSWKSRTIFGHDMFNNRSLSFEPNMSLPTPENYVLGPGDEVIVEIWGSNEAHFRQTISPEGRIMVSQIGPIYLSGLTIKKANELVKNAFAQKYSGVLGEDPSSQIVLTLGSVRTIQVNIFGEVGTPGTYRLSSFSNVFHALYRAGGVSTSGTVRAIEVIRKGKKIATIDLYPYLFTGILKDDFQLQDADVIRVPLYGKLASIEGKVKRPMYYEIKDGETLQDLIDFAGGFEGDAYKAELRIMRQTGREREVNTVSSSRYSSYKLETGDAVYVGATLDRFANRVEVRGSVFRPGVYELGSEMHTVKELVLRAEGLMEDAFTNRVRLLRQQDDFTPEVISLDLGKIMRGEAPDVTLVKNDILEIQSIHALKDLGSVTIEGFVANPGTYTFAENMSIEDLVLQAGGLLNGASAVRVDVSRRINNPYSTMPTDTLAQEISFPLDHNLKLENGNRFLLQPYDIVRIRKSPTYKTQTNVSVEGEVAFPGSYTILNNNERISDLISRAGGVTPHSYLRGAVLVRRVNKEESTLASATRRMLRQGGGKDSIDVNKLQQSTKYTVGLELDKALENPGSDYDLVLRDGDRLIVPEYLSTVKINGDVMYPNVVLYKPGASMKYYIDLAGGYGSTAKRSKAYIIYMNGNISRGKAARNIEPGCEIVIPSRDTKKKGMTTAETLAIATSTASVGTMIATLLNSLRK